MEIKSLPSQTHTIIAQQRDLSKIHMETPFLGHWVAPLLGQTFRGKACNTGLDNSSFCCRTLVRGLILSKGGYKRLCPSVHIQLLFSNRLQARWTHVTPALWLISWCGPHHAHAQNHITREGILPLFPAAKSVLPLRVFWNRLGGINLSVL